jgi:pilus assembly protein FimV
LFALARRHAVPGVSVYQWMIGVMQANPQAFINDNVNLIKAGATLNVPGSEQLTALSDREARDIFQKHASAFAQYRQRLAGEVARVEPAIAQPADSGQVTTPATQSEPAPASQTQDRLVLQSAQAATTEGSSPGSVDNQSGDQGASGQAVNGQAAPVSSTSSDDQFALERNTEEARERVNQLEDNVKNLNQALQQQGTAAHEAVVEGARTVEATVEQLKKIVDEETAGSETVSTGTDAKGNMASVDSDRVAGQAGGSGSSGGNRGTDATSNDQKGPSIALEANAPSVSGSESANATSSGTAVPGTTASGAESGDDANSLSSWFMNNLLIVISGALALIVLILAWLLRRVGAERDDDSDAAITEEMVRERLQSINLDLDDSSDSGPPEKRR